MDFYEIEGKTQYKRFGIPTDVGALYTDDMDLAAVEYPCVVKAQVLAGHRGQAGGVKIARTPEQLADYARTISGLVISGRPVQAILIAPMVHITREFYMGITLDRVARQAVMLFTAFGGMDIEELAATSPEKLIRLDCTSGFDAAAFARAASVFGLDDAIMSQLLDIGSKLTTMYFELDATTAEINPLVVNEKGILTAIDSKLVIDDNALYRQGDYTLIPRKAIKSEDISAREAESAGLSYVELDPDGDVGLMAGGAGLGMLTVDTIGYYGGKPHNFLDLGGGVTAEKTYAAMELLLKNPSIKSILVNIFGGINNCDIMSQGIVAAMRDFGCGKRVVVKSRGHGQEEGWKRFEQAGCLQVKYGSTDDAVKLLLGKEGAK
ncbi:MAG TPA: succinyl-CoA synthetase [Clostridiales bacterium]|nr:succinyl-CoA synthetase [Clostridiales bacterium]HBR09018.1 succinyl-CoA synthetase [Clostridiales bacterium]